MPRHIGLILDYAFAYTRGVLRGVKQYAQERPGWLLVDLAEGFTPHTLKLMKPAGLIAHVDNRRLLRLLQSQCRPVVNVSFALPETPFSSVGIDQRQVGRLAFRHLHDCGLRHFGFVGHPRHSYSLDREAGFREPLAGTQFSYTHFYQLPARPDHHSSQLLALRADFQRWLRALPKPVGILACHDAWGRQVGEACRLMGLRVPDEVAIIGVNNDDLLCELAYPTLSSIELASERVGVEAAAQLNRILRGAKPRKPPRLLSPVGVVARQSTDLFASDDPELTAAIRYIRDHVHRPLNVDDVLRAVPTSRRSLERKFRTVLLRGIGEEIRRAHLECAKHLLATTVMSVSEVAVKSGYNSVHYLSRIFRHETGQTPTEYRRQFRELVRMTS